MNFRVLNISPGIKTFEKKKKIIRIIKEKKKNL